ncbi:MAG: efflux RND transporter periplasmic adaptor subunit [Rhodospirillales bacterium]|nr:efflux RND transporter periplasmic adaptor subunit [Rhodospirillales bacterium]
MRTSYLISAVIALLATLWVFSAVVFPAQKDPVSSAAAASSSPAQAEAEPSQSQEAKTPPSVRVQASTAVPVTDVAVITGRTQANRTVTLAAELNARLEDILVEEGRVVKQGDLLATLAVEDRAVRVQEAKYLLNQRQIEYNAAKSLEKQGFNSQIRLAEALAQLESARADLKLAEKNLKNTEITAPFDSIINIQHLEAGDYVREGDAVFTLVDLDPLEMVGYLSENDVIHVQKDVPVTAKFLNGTEVAGQLTFVAPAADPQTRTFRIIATLANPDGAFPDGLTAEMHIPMADVQAHRLPTSNLTLNDQGSLGIKVVDERNTVRFYPIHVVSSQNGAAYVSGLPAQAQIITVGAEFVADGTVVTPVAAPAAEARLK